MIRLEKIWIFYSIYLLSIQANVWDNIFFEETVPIRIPEEFTMFLAHESPGIDLVLEVKTSSSHNKVSIQQKIQNKLPPMPPLPMPPLPNGVPGGFGQVNPQNLLQDRDLGRVIIDLHKSEADINSLLKPCTRLGFSNRTEPFLREMNRYLGLATLLLDFEKKDGLYRVDMKNLLKLQNITDLNVYLYLDRDSNLKKIDIVFPDAPPITFVVKELIKSTFEEKEFIVPNDWKCSDEDLRSIEDFDMEEFQEEFTPEKMKDFIDPDVLKKFDISEEDIEEALDALEEFLNGFN